MHKCLPIFLSWALIAGSFPLIGKFCVAKSWCQIVTIHPNYEDPIDYRFH